MELSTNQDNQELLQALSNALPYIEQVLKTHKSLFDGKRCLMSEELCTILKISHHTLQDYRNDDNKTIRQSATYAAIHGHFFAVQNDHELT